ncbi:unnamed protein product [Fraxinus pennsylvanica]|uniref:BED-type domain-containing protein n=1 Tax=Fraxinus pennsylvanica TaxID=56036 RepID=A0AAD1YSY8_9LAMI|nr:unnamed protein product [Fraxinus pennsylvanica]
MRGVKRKPERGWGLWGGRHEPNLSPLSFNSSDRRLPIFSRCHHLPPANHREDIFTSSSSDLRRTDIILIEPLFIQTKQKVRCNYCHREFSGGVYRIKFHLAQIRNKDIVPCSEVPTDVRDHVQGILSNPKRQRTPKRQKMEQVENGHQNSSSASGGALPNHGSSEQNGSACPSLLFPRSSPSAPPEPALEDAQKQKQDDADKKVAAFFFYNSIPFNAAKSTYYQDMVDAIAECGIGFKAPTFEKLRCNLLDKVKGDIHDLYRKMRNEWKETGCTILCNCWSDAAAFLNPSIFYSLSFKVDSRMRNGFQEAMMKMAIDDKDRIEITKEHPVYINAHGALGTEFAVKGRTLNAPGDWWAAYGYEIPTLQRSAIRILSQPWKKDMSRPSSSKENGNVKELRSCIHLIGNYWRAKNLKNSENFGIVD